MLSWRDDNVFNNERQIAHFVLTLSELFEEAVLQTVLKAYLLNEYK